MTNSLRVRLNGNATVHTAATVGEGDDLRITGRKCDPYPGGGWKRVKAIVTTDELTCKSCIRIAAANN